VPVLENMARLEHWRALSHVDPITEVFNRRYFDLRFAEEVARSHRFKRPLSLAVLDIDNLKAVNDSYGHQMGDSVLRRTARCARRAIRSIDVFCRLAGDEFAILMPDADLTRHPGFGERLCGVLTRRHTVANEMPAEVTVTVSMGGAVMPDHGDDPERLLWCADVALLNAKQKGRGCFLLYHSSLELPRNSDPETI
jgi:two-component system cell cycle response regulator